MTQHDRRNSSEVPPENWTPESDADPQWEAMRALLEEADAPQLPSAERFDAIRAAAAAELREDPPRVVEVEPGPRSRRRAAAAPARPGARVLLFGGGPVGQALRLAAVGALAFVFGVEIAGRGTEAPAPTVIATQPDSTQVASIPPLEAEHLEAIPAERPPAIGAGQRIPRSLHDDSFAPGLAAPGIDGAGLVPVRAHDGDWFLYSHFGSAMDARGGSADGADSPARLLEKIRQIRVQASLIGDHATAAKVRELEEALWPMLIDEDLVPESEAEAYAALEQADRLVATARYDEAIEAYRDVLAHSRGTALASTAHFQLARVLFEEMRDYDAALAAYRAVLEDYPRQYLTTEQRDHALGRVELLSRNYASNWMAVRLWQDIEQSSGRERLARLEELLHRTPQSPLASEAAIELAERAAEGAYPSREAVEELLGKLDRALERAGGAPHAAGLQYARAEIVLQRLYDRERAADEYLRVLRLPGSSAFADRARTRLSQLEQ